MINFIFIGLAPGERSDAREENDFFGQIKQKNEFCNLRFGFSQRIKYSTKLDI